MKVYEVLEDYLGFPKRAVAVLYKTVALVVFAAGMSLALVATFTPDSALASVPYPTVETALSLADDLRVSPRFLVLLYGFLVSTVAAAFYLFTKGFVHSVRHDNVSARQVGLRFVVFVSFAAGFVGLFSHPFGDLATGEPPAFFYPFDAPLITERVALSADPTLHLLGAFGVELAAIWAGLLVAMWLLERPIQPAVDVRAVAGAGYALAALAIPAPTLDFSYQFVFSVLAVGMIGAAPRLRLPDVTVERPSGIGATVTGLTALTVAGVVTVLTPLDHQFA